MSFRPDVWTAANDGSGSNLDADKLDNLSSADFELALGNPGTDGFHLVSTAAGVRSWEASPGTAYSLFRREGFTAMAARETFHLSGGQNILITAADDAGNDETDITIAVDLSALDADTLDTFHASSFTQKSVNETISGAWHFDNNIVLDGTGTDKKRIMFDAVDLAFSRNMGWKFSHNGQGNDLHKSVIQVTTGDFLWQVSSAGWKTVYEVIIATQVMDFAERPTWDGNDLALLSEAGGDPTGPVSGLTDVTITSIGSGEVLKWSGSAWINNTLSEAGIQAAGSFLTDITGEPLSDLSDVTIVSIGTDEMLQWNGSAWINQTLAEIGIPDIAGTVVVTGAWNFTTATLKIGGSAGSPDLEITDDSSRDPRLKAPGGKMTIETLGSTTATGDGLYLDDGGTTNAKVVGIKLITNSATTPTGDYPYGTLHLIY